MTRARFLLSLAFFVLFSPVLAQAKGQPKEDVSLGFAESLFDGGDYYRAIGEYKRFLYLNPQHPRKPEAEYRIALCYLRAEKYDQARDAFQALSAEPEAGLWAEKAAAKKGDIPYFQGDYAAALADWQQFQKSFPQSGQKARLLYLTGWAQAWQFDFKGSRDAFLAVEGLGTSSADLKNSAHRVAEKLNSVSLLPSRSSLVSGLLSIIPGLGQLYCDRGGDAFSALVTCGLTGYLAYISIQKQDTGGSVAWGTLAGLFYGGNIYGGIASAERFNRLTKQNFVQGLEGLKLISVEQSF